MTFMRLTTFMKEISDTRAESRHQDMDLPAYLECLPDAGEYIEHVILVEHVQKTSWRRLGGCGAGRKSKPSRQQAG
jgi:hypothetical protein